MNMSLFTRGTGVVFVLGYHNDELHMWRQKKKKKSMLSIFQMVELGLLYEYYKNIYYGSILERPFKYSSKYIHCFTCPEMQYDFATLPTTHRDNTSLVI